MPTNLHCFPKNIQVDALAQLSLNRPVRVRVDESYEVAPRLEQEVSLFALLVPLVSSAVACRWL